MGSFDPWWTPVEFTECLPGLEDAPAGIKMTLFLCGYELPVMVKESKQNIKVSISLFPGLEMQSNICFLNNNEKFGMACELYIFKMHHYKEMLVTCI